MEWYDKALHYLVPLAWPVLVMIILCLFKRQIRDLLVALVKLIEKSEVLSIGPWLTLGPRPEDLVQINAVEPRGSELQVHKIHIRKMKRLDEQVNELLRHALNCSRREEHEEAINHLKLANQMLPNQWSVLHNLGTDLIRAGIKAKRYDLFIQAEEACRNAIYVAPSFPYGTYYNLARAQAALGDTLALRTTFSRMEKVDLPDKLARAIADGDPDLTRGSDDIENMTEYKSLVNLMKARFGMTD